MINKKAIKIRDSIFKFLMLFVWDVIAIVLFTIFFPIVFPILWSIRIVAWFFNDLNMKDTIYSLKSRNDEEIINAFIPRARSLKYLFGDDLL